MSELIDQARAEGKKRILAQARVTVVESVYHFLPNRQPGGRELRHSRVLASHEQRYERTFRVGPEWQRLDPAWVKEASLFLLENEEGKGLTKIPSPAQRAEIDARIVEVGAGKDGPSLVTDLVPPGQSIRRIPADLNIWLRCRSGEAEVTLTLVPA